MLQPNDVVVKIYSRSSGAPHIVKTAHTYALTTRCGLKLNVDMVVKLAKKQAEKTRFYICATCLWSLKAEQRSNK